MPFGRPFRAISLCVSFPGLKPWAVFCSPVGRLELAQENVQTPGGKPRAQPRAESYNSSGAKTQPGSSTATFSKCPNCRTPGR